MDPHTFTVSLGFVAGALYIAAHYMKTMVPLRLCEIASNALFVVYGALYPSWPTLALYGILVPLNSLRLYEMLQLIKSVRSAAQGDLSMDWLKPFMRRNTFKKGSILFNKGDHAEEMYYILSGRCRVNQLGLELAPGHMVGELGFLVPENVRTQTVECVDDVELLSISYDKVRELYFQNPSFGFYLLRLSSERLLQNVDRMERALEAHTQLAQLTKRVRATAEGDMSIDWLKPFMHKHAYKKGSILFNKGDHAEEMYYIASGRCRVNELDLELAPGHVVGELGFLAPQNMRTQTVECVDDVELLSISYDKVRALYFQNPSFGLHLMQLASERLLQNVDRLEQALKDRTQFASL